MKTANLSNLARNPASNSVNVVSSLEEGKGDLETVGGEHGDQERTDKKQETHRKGHSLKELERSRCQGREESQGRGGLNEYLSM